MFCHYVEAILLLFVFLIVLIWRGFFLEGGGWLNKD